MGLKVSADLLQILMVLGQKVPMTIGWDRLFSIKFTAWLVMFTTLISIEKSSDCKTKLMPFK